MEASALFSVTQPINEVDLTYFVSVSAMQSLF